MRAVKIHGTRNKIQRLIKLSKEALRDGAYRTARRLHAVALNMEGKAAPEIADVLKVHRSKVCIWLRNWQEHGMESVLEGHRPGRPSSMLVEHRQRLCDILDSGPVAYGFTSGVWTSPMVARVIEEEFSITYHPAHVCRLLHELGFSVQRPKRALVQADKAAQSRWVRYKYPNIKKKPKTKGRLLSSKTRRVPTRPHTLPHMGAHRISTRNTHHGTEKHSEDFRHNRIVLRALPLLFQQVFNAETYVAYLERIVRCYFPRKIFLIQDNASYHKDRGVWAWFSDNRKLIEVYNLPPYSPELNALERIWHHTRLHGTHNRYFPTQDELRLALTSTFRSIQRNPSQVMGYLHPYQ